MKHLRIFILVLLSVLLPVRGAVAAAMLCPDGVATNAAMAVAEHGPHAMHADHSAAHHHAGAEVTDEDSSSGEHPTICHFCASGCCMASIVGAFAPIGPPELTASVTFPALTAPVPAFQSGGQDRPPRTI